MIAAQTLNLYNYYNNDDTYSIRLHLIMSLLSSYLLRKHYDKVILYCDEKTSEILKDSFYTEVRILPNNILTQYGYGTLSKLYSYSNIEEEYIHFDIDYFLFNKLELNDNLICRHSESREKVGESDFNKAYSGLIEKLKINYTDFGFNVINENYVMNMCVFGVPKNHHTLVCNYFKKLNEYTQQNIETIYNTYSKELPPHWAIEQYIPAQFFLENNIIIEELNDYENFQIRKHFDYIRLYEMKNFSLVNSVKLKDVNIKQVLANYMSKNIGHHLWISKNVSNVDELLINVIKEMYPELYKKINLILGIKENNNKTFI
jgi:hypothetical protein